MSFDNDVLNFIFFHEEFFVILWFDSNYEVFPKTSRFVEVNKHNKEYWGVFDKSVLFFYLFFFKRGTVRQK